MPHVCPRPCSRLATAAVFMSVGVVQFVVGIVLLRSKYVYLLAGPDFWTSSCNIAVGCLLGLSASVWKQSRKRRSKKYIIRRNLLLALLFSALVMNGTTLGIFLLGEGNALLSIRLENGGKYNHSTFASEVLAYAYVTSVCCPIVCIVVTIVSMSGSCIKYAVRKNSLEMRTPVENIEKERSRSLRWVYTPELFDFSKKKAREHILTSSSESASDNESDQVSVRQKKTYSAEDVQKVLERMAQGKRESILSDSAIMLQQMDLRRKTRYNSSNQDGSYMGPALSRSRESVMSERFPEDHSIRHDDSTTLPRTGKPKRDYSDFYGEISLSPGDLTKKRLNYAKSKQFSVLYKNPYTSEELLNEYQKAASKLEKHYPSQYKKFRERPQSASEVEVSASSYTTPDVTDYRNRNIAGVHKKVAKMSEMETVNATPAEYISQKRNRESRAELQGNEEFHQRESLQEVISPTDCFSPDESECGSNLTFDISKRSSWAGEVVPINIKHSSAVRFSNKLIPVASPVVPGMQQTHDLPKISDDSGIGTIESSSFTEVADQSDFKDKKKFSSFQEDSKVRSKENMEEYPKIGSQSIKKYDLNKMVAMASISEEPNLETPQSLERRQRDCYSQDELDCKKWQGHLRNKSLSSLQSGSSRVTNYGEEISKRDTTPKRKRSASGRSLKKIWSLATFENQPDFLDQVVDKDSLIGLSEEELIARQFRTRSIRKAVQQRMKEGLAV